MVTGGEREGALFAATVVADVDPAMRISCEELFGPAVGGDARSPDAEEALALANDSDYGLCAGIFTQDIDRAPCASPAKPTPASSTSTAPRRGAPISCRTAASSTAASAMEGPRYAVQEMTEVKTVVFHERRADERDTPSEARPRPCTGAGRVRLTMAQALVRYLQVQYSERDGESARLIPAMFGIFGHGNVAGLGQALDRVRPRAALLPAVQRAVAWCTPPPATPRQPNRRATLACTASIGPGSTNMLTGAALATINRLPGAAAALRLLRHAPAGAGAAAARAPDLARRRA